MKFVKLGFLAVAAATVFAGCCQTRNTKCYPYPLYDYSPARICATAPVCAPTCTPVAPCTSACAPAGQF